MSLPIRLQPEAEEDIGEAAKWYEQQRVGLGSVFLDEIQRALLSIAEQPAQYPVMHRRVRRALAHRFPFGTYYRVEPEQIVVPAVIHGSRSPRRWQGR